ncbi:hypothetical protein C4N20_09755 [Fusobacterium ulcerans]|nr:hypothetical protein C4N20_09755 [Fusobacterium ulcerans]
MFFIFLFLYNFFIFFCSFFLFLIFFNSLYFFLSKSKNINLNYKIIFKNHLLFFTAIFIFSENKKTQTHLSEIFCIFPIKFYSSKKIQKDF